MAEKPEFTPNPNLIKYARLQILSNKGNGYLCQAFIKKWNSMDGNSKWQDSVSDRQEFITGAGKELYKNSSNIQKEYLSFRKISDWHLPLLIKCVKCLKADAPLKLFEDLKALRSKLVNLAKADTVRDEEYDRYWKQMSTLLLDIGLSKDEINVIKSSSIETLEESFENLTIDPKVTRLKNSGNDVFKNDKFKEAVEFYTKAICTPDVPKKELAILYSNRSVAYLNLGDTASAMDNAKSAIHLNQTWWKGYYRLAMACQAKKSHKLHLFYLLLAQQFHDKPKNLEPEIEFCKRLIGQKDKKDHYNPAYRKQITLGHRFRFKELMALLFGVTSLRELSGRREPLGPATLVKRPKNMLSGYKRIFLEEMDDGCDYVFVEYVVRLTLMEDPHEKLGGGAIHTVVRDDRDTYQRLAIYDYDPSRSDLLANLGFGSKISIIDPYYRVALDGSACIRVDDFDTVFVHHELKNSKICRYCGDDTIGRFSCKECKSRYYCSARCMNLDRSELQHELICDLAVAFPI